MDSENNNKPPAKESLQQGVHYYINSYGYWVFTEEYHKLRGFCCKSGCKHCPYGFVKPPMH